jgi:hypothetical protein
MNERWTRLFINMMQEEEREEKEDSFLSVEET